MAGVVADRVIVELEAKLDRYNANVRAAEARFDSAARGIQRSATQVERSMARSTGAIGNHLRTLAATFAAAFTVRQVAAFADSYTRFTNQLKVAGIEGERLGITQNELFAIAQKYGVELETLGTLYSRITQASKELGASSVETMTFTNGVAAALKIQGGAASESRGALLQLAQALGSPIVRAEEFNSINEGARPILQAVASGIDRYKGSVAKLRNEVIAGKVTSQEFFQGFLKGSADLEAKAGKANLTIAASFTVLNNALGKFIGETDASLSATQRVSAAIISLSENLDTVVKALAVIATILGARYIAAAFAAARATGLVSTAIFAMQARAIGAATTMEALALAGATAGRTLLAAFGGPVGLAVIALTAGIYYLSTRTNEATQASAAYTNAAAALATIQHKTTSATDALATATGRARVEALANAKALQQETIQYIANAKAALAAARAKAAVKLNEAREAAVQTQADFGEMGGARISPNRQKFNRKRQEAIQAAADARQAETNLRNAEKTLADITRSIQAPPAIRDVPVPKVKKPKKAKAGRDPDDITRQFQDDLDRGSIEYERAMQDVLGTVYGRISTEKHAIQVESDITARGIKADKDLSASRKAQLLQLNDQITKARLEAIDAEERRALAQDAVDLATGDINNRRAQLEAQQELATTTVARKDIELKLLDLQYQEERIRLEAIVANTTLRDAEREAARRALAALDNRKTAEQQNIEKRNQGPGKDYLDALNADDINEQFQKIQVEGLKGLEDQLTSTIAKVFELGGAFGKIANQIISDLIRIAVQKAIIGPLANALFGGGSGLGGLLGGIFGGGVTPGGPASATPRAGGGHVRAGQLYRVNENGVEAFQPGGSGKIIPLGRLNSAGGGGTTVLQHFTLDARYGITTPELLRHVHQVAAARATQAGRAAYDAAQKGVPARFNKLQKLGT